MTIRPKRSYCHRCPVVAYFTHLCRVDTATITLWTAPFFSRRVYGLLGILLCFVEILVFNANSKNPDQMPHSAASGLDLHCLSVSLLLDTMH